MRVYRRRDERLAAPHRAKTVRVGDPAQARDLQANRQTLIQAARQPELPHCLLTFRPHKFRLTRAAFKRRKESMRRRTAVQMLGALALMAPTAASKLWAQGEKKEQKKE